MTVLLNVLYNTCIHVLVGNISTVSFKLGNGQKRLRTAVLEECKFQITNIYSINMGYTSTSLYKSL